MRRILIVLICCMTATMSSCGGSSGSSNGQLATIQNQLFPGVTRGSTITLPLTGALLKTVISVTSQVPGITFTEGSDYTVNYALGTIFILPGGRIDNPASGSGMDLFISYTDLMGP